MVLRTVTKDAARNPCYIPENWNDRGRGRVWAKSLLKQNIEIRAQQGAQGVHGDRPRAQAAASPSMDHFQQGASRLGNCGWQGNRVFQEPWKGDRKEQFTRWVGSSRGAAENL